MEVKCGVLSQGNVKRCVNPFITEIIVILKPYTRFYAFLCLVICEGKKRTKPPHRYEVNVCKSDSIKKKTRKIIQNNERFFIRVT